MKRSSRGLRRRRRSSPGDVEMQHGARLAGGVELALDAVLARGPHLLHLHRRIPVGRRGDGAGVGAEADQGGLLAEAAAAQLAEIELAAHAAHVGEARVADVRVVRPHHRLGALAAMAEQVLQGLEHVAVAQVPALGAAVVHGAVVALGGGDQPGILRGIEELLAVMARHSPAAWPEDRARLPPCRPRRRDSARSARRGHRPRDRAATA